MGSGMPRSSQRVANVVRQLLREKSGMPFERQKAVNFFVTYSGLKSKRRTSGLQYSNGKRASRSSGNILTVRREPLVFKTAVSSPRISTCRSMCNSFRLKSLHFRRSPRASFRRNPAYSKKWLPRQPFLLAVIGKILFIFVLIYCDFADNMIYL